MELHVPLVLLLCVVCCMFNNYYIIYNDSGPAPSGEKFKEHTASRRAGNAKRSCSSWRCVFTGRVYWLWYYTRCSFTGLQFEFESKF